MNPLRHRLGPRREEGWRALSIPRFVALAAILGCAGSSPHGAPGGRERPNVLFVIADDQSYPHASAYGCRFVRTPGFDRVAREGVLFDHAFVSAPSCAPSRASLLTGEAFYRLGDASMNHVIWPSELETFPDALEAAGYAVGFTGKGWGPGRLASDRAASGPTGRGYQEAKSSVSGRVDPAANFAAFLDEKPEGAPFCFWVGLPEPHRPYEAGSGEAHGIRVESRDVPKFLPDVPEVRSDLADYALAIERGDADLVRVLELLDARGELERTLVVVTSDNGMPFPGAKATLYDAGTRVPLAVRWGERVPSGRTVHDFVSATDLAPTILEAAGLPVPERMTGRSLLGILSSRRAGRLETMRDAVVMGFERHLPGAREDGAGYPMRALRTEKYLFIRNLNPRTNPAGDSPGATWPEDDPAGGFGDVDGSPSKTLLFEKRESHSSLWDRAFGLRPAEEIYRIADDPDQLRNLAGTPGMDTIPWLLERRLDAMLRATGDPRILGHGRSLDEVVLRFPAVLDSGAGSRRER